MTGAPVTVVVPHKYPCSMFFVDESSAKESAGSFFVVGAVKVREPGKLARAIQAIRDVNDFDEEFKFSRISRGKLPVFHQVIDALEGSDAHIGACVVDRSVNNPFSRDEAEWVTHARITAKLLVGLMVRRELSSAVLDERSTPVGFAFDDTVRAMVNGRLKATGLVSAVCVDSAANDCVQLADLVAGAVAHQRRGGPVNPNSHKAKIAGRLAAAFGITSFQDIRSDRVNIQTYGVVTPKRAVASLTKLPSTNG